MNRKMNLFLLVLLGLVLSACAGKKTQEQVSEVDVVVEEEIVSSGPSVNANNAFGTGYSIEQLRSVGIEGNPLNYTTLYFAYNKSNLDERSKIIAAAHARNVLARGGAKITLKGYTDERGTRDYNLALGERRGQTVANYMGAQGVSTNSIKVISYGEENPVDPAHTEAAWAKNRRVEMSFVY